MEKHVRYVEDVAHDSEKSPGAYARSQRFFKSKISSNSSTSEDNVEDQVKPVHVAAAKLSLQWPILSSKDVRKAKSMAVRGINSKSQMEKQSASTFS